MGEVRFIRKHGRIIPIRNKQDRKKASVGAAQVASGAAVTYGSGYLGGKLFRYANKQKEIIEKSVDVASDLMVKTKKSRKTGARIPMGQLSFSGFEVEKARKAVPKFKSGLFASAKTLKYGGHGIGAVLLGAGMQKIYEGSTGRDVGTMGEITSAAAGYGTMRLITSGFKRGAGKNLLKILSRGKIK